MRYETDGRLPFLAASIAGGVHRPRAVGYYRQKTISLVLNRLRVADVDFLEIQLLGFFDN
jgi:hypothetical protein